jgi:hypothetical protein
LFFQNLIPVRSAMWAVTFAACAYAGTAWSVDGSVDADASAGTSATAPVAGSRPAVTTLNGDVAPADAQGNVAELTQQLHDGKVVELRTTYNGSYGASMMFEPQQMTYYVALFQDKHLWRVIKSQDKSRAEMIYANFVQQTAQLSDVEIRRTELQAQKAFLERVIALSENHAQRLQADLNVAHAQQAEVAQRQKAAQDQTRALQIEQRAAQAQLRELQQQVQQLQRQAETGLPAQP